LIGPFFLTPTPNSDRPPSLSSKLIFVALSTRAAAAASAGWRRLLRAEASSERRVMVFDKAIVDTISRRYDICCERWKVEGGTGWNEARVMQGLSRRR
jgi:hypothetical protein